MKNFKLFFLLLAVGFLFLIFPFNAQAQEGDGLVENLIANTPLIRADLISIIFKIIQYALGFLGVVAVVILIYGGFVWMTAKGNDEKVQKAKKIIINGLIGLVIVLLSYTIVSFAIGRVREISEPPDKCIPGTCCANYLAWSDDCVCNVYDPNCGSGPDPNCFNVTYTYPRDGQKNVSTCPVAQALFNAELKDDTIYSCINIDNGDDCNKALGCNWDEEDSVCIGTGTVFVDLTGVLDDEGKCRGIPGGHNSECDENADCKSGKCLEGTCYGDTIAGSFVVDGPAFRFTAENDFGIKTCYRFMITTMIRDTRARPLCAQRIINFTTGTEGDDIPPFVEETFPEPDQEGVCLLDPVIVVFSEEMDVISLRNQKSFSTDPSHTFRHKVLNNFTILEASPKTRYQAETWYQASLDDQIIRDVCGNFLDCGNNKCIWNFKTDSERDVCKPEITEIVPSTGYYNDEIAIKGKDFKIGGEVIFNNQVFANAFCFDDDNFPRQDQSCLISWTNTEIKLRVPAAGGISEGVISGGVIVWVGSFASEPKNFIMLSPYIQSFDPRSGGRDQAVAIKGERFGVDQGNLYFINQETLERIEGTLVCEEAGWRENEIIVAVPEDLAFGNYFFQVERADGKFSNVRRSEIFEVNDQESGPVLCDIEPYCPGTSLRGGQGSIPPVDEKKLSGDRFGEGGAGNQGRVLFNNIEAEIKLWRNEEIGIIVPSEIPPHNRQLTYQVRVLDQDNRESNPLSFMSPCVIRGPLGSECFLEPNTCTTEMCLPPYGCVSGSNGALECRCCCTVEGGCPDPLECEPTEVCVRNRKTGVEVYGVCCGCQTSEQCIAGEICKQKGEDRPNCCYACELGDEGKECKGGECCSHNCNVFQSQANCEEKDSCSWINGVCHGGYDPYCCFNGYCQDHQCKLFCGDGTIQPEKGEVCDLEVDLDEYCRTMNQDECIEHIASCSWTEEEVCRGKTCEDFGRISGKLQCAADCKSFDLSGCLSPKSGKWGDYCQLPALGCDLGAQDCALAVGADCVQNNPEKPCACCCRPDASDECAEIENPDDCQKDFRCQLINGVCESVGDSCKEINEKFYCAINETCNQNGQLGLCCGCQEDEECNEGIGFACINNCCVPFPPPKELIVTVADPETIKMKWKYSDWREMATHFEIWKKEPGEKTEYILLTTCQKNDPYQCDPNENYTLKSPSADRYELEEKGEFKVGKDYYYRIRAKRGTTTAYSEFTKPAKGTVVGVVICSQNADCPNQAPCCREDTGMCVTWDYCQGRCKEDTEDPIRCYPPDEKFATHDFGIIEGPNGPCLRAANPNQGYPCEPDINKNTLQVILTGLKFGSRGTGEGVFFNGDPGSEFNYIKEACDGCQTAGCQYFSWQDEEIIIDRTPPWEAETGLVRIKKIIDGETFWSNGLNFRILRKEAGPGQECKTDILGCPVGGNCDNVIHFCLECNCQLFRTPSECQAQASYCQWENENCQNVICEQFQNQPDCKNYQHCQWEEARNRCFTISSHCRCCCEPGALSDLCKNLPGGERMVCEPDQGFCTGLNRGLCCGCEYDTDCNLEGNDQGCDLGKPRCCRPRPELESISFCDDIGTPDVRSNTNVTMIFNEKMDFRSLNIDNIRVSRVGQCDPQEGKEEGGGLGILRCYLTGTISNINNEDDKTESVFSPKICDLKLGTVYTIEMVVGEDGVGIRSEKGVSMNQGKGDCTWDENKQCQVRTFTTSPDPAAFCEIDWIDVWPRKLITVRDVDVKIPYSAFARDKENRSVCVLGFNWSSSDEGIATVIADPDDPRKGIATSGNINGEIKVIAAIIPLAPIPEKTCDTMPGHTCGQLKVSLAGPQVVENRTCETCGEGQTPSPWKNSTDACLDAQIVARFNQPMNPPTLNSTNIIVRECPGLDFKDNKCDDDAARLIPGTITFIEEKDEQGNDHTIGFRFNLEESLQPDKIHRVTLKSGKFGIKNKYGRQLDGNRNGIEDGSPIDDYVWYFKTGDFGLGDTTCMISKVCVLPQTAKILHQPFFPPATQNFEAEIHAKNCNYINPGNYSWHWSREKIEPWQSDQVVNLRSLNPPNHYQAIASSLGLGEVFIRATTQGGVFDQGRLTVATVPLVETTYPSGSDLCLNTAIYAKFNQIMNQTSFPNNFKIEGEIKDDLGQPIRIDETENFSFRFETDTKENKTIVHFIPKSFLKPNTRYYITIYGIGGDSPVGGVKSAMPFDEPMRNNETWNFSTGEFPCRLERIEIEPDSYFFTKSRDQKIFTAKAMYRDMEIQPVPGFYEWAWKWHSDDANIARVIGGDNLKEVTTESRANGLTNIIATAKITVDDIFKPSSVGQFKQGQARIEVWICDNPWPSTKFPEGEMYEDEKTNFAFRYCRDAGSPGLEGDLPILKGGKITGPEEPGKLNEHFFTVYDGSLSFYYDGESTTHQVKPPITFVTNKSGYNNGEYDIFGNNNAVMENVSQVDGGKFGKALSFAGNENSYLKVDASGVPYGHNLTIEPEKFTLTAWVSPAKLITPSGSIFKKGWQEIGVGQGIGGEGIGIDMGAGLGAGYGLEIINGEVYFWLFDKEGNKAETKAGPIAHSVWTHLAASYDGKNLKIYLNGVLKSEPSVSLKGDVTHFEDDLFIGQNFKGLLDEIAFYHKTLTQAETEEHLQKPISPTLGDVLGFKVFGNLEHLLPAEWYAKYAPGRVDVAGAHSFVDGYRAYQVGRTVYVGATNVDNNNIYSNIYLVSQSESPRSETSQVFRSSINNWRFNINIENPKLCSETTKICSKDLDCPANETCDAPKDKLTRDFERIYDLRRVWQSLEAYPLRNIKESDSYPKLETGTYIIGMSTSKWPSWTPQTGLGQDLIMAGVSVLPNDPINRFNLREDGCGLLPTQYACCANCPRNNPDCTQTCFNPQELKYECAGGSQVYQYMTEGRPVGSQYSLYLNFEYSNPDFWQHGCDGLGGFDCQTRAFCHWQPRGTTYLPQSFVMATEDPEIPMECVKRNLNYNGNPCKDLDMNCACFNARFTSIYVPPPPVPQIISFQANPPTVPSDGSTTLSWSTANVTSCTASSIPAHSGWQGEVLSLGQKTVYNLIDTTTFTLTCHGSGGQRVSASVGVDVIVLPPPTCTVTASPNPIDSGQTTILTWNISNGPANGMWSPSPGGGCTNFSNSYGGNCTTGSISSTRTFTLTVSNTQGSGSCSVAVTTQHTLSVSKTGTGLGRINFNPPNTTNREILPHSKKYNYNTQVVLTAYPDLGSIFTGWSGACSGAGTCTVTMSANRSVTANFNLVDTYVYAADGIAGGTATIYKINKNDMENRTSGSATYYGKVHALTEDENYLYVAGASSKIIRKINKNNMEIVSPNGNSPELDDTIYALYQAGEFIYAGTLGDTVYKISKTNMTIVGSPVNVGRTIRAIIVDDNYVYAAGSFGYLFRLNKDLGDLMTYRFGTSLLRSIGQDETYLYTAGLGNTIYKIDKSTMSVPRSEDVGSSVYALVVDASYVYVGGRANYVYKYNKGDLTYTYQALNYEGDVNAIVTDENYLYVAGDRQPREVWKIDKSNMTKVDQTSSFTYSIEALSCR